MSHLMIIGGTGMLRGVALAFVERGWTVSVVGRRTGPLTQLAEQAAGARGTIVPLAADYTQPASFTAHLRAAVGEHGVPTVVVAWIHDTAPEAPLLVAQEMVAAADGRPIDFVHVLSRLRTDDPRDRSVPAPCPDEETLRDLPGLIYRRAVLGWIVEPTGSRWLTDQEIAEGVIRAVDSDAGLTRIGQTEPLESNPSHVDAGQDGPGHD